MPLNPSIKFIELMFRPLNQEAATFPIRKALSEELSKLVRSNVKTDYDVNVNNATVKKFGTASVEMWHRAIHSYLISASITKSSPIWSSTCGYYSSHYSVRAFAHLLGYFQLFKKKRIVKLELNGANYSCRFQGKNGNDREHKFYWQIVNSNSLFSANPFFTNNEEEISDNSGELVSDSGHRSIANYADHVSNFPTFQVLDNQELENRLNKIAGLNLSDAPIPRPDRYPDLDNVQVIAYQRLVAYRAFLDEVLGSSNRFWNKHRNPGWVPEYFDYQFIKPEYISIYKSVGE